jgi:hypothetical protein
MVILAVVGAAVLALFSWAALREAQQMSVRSIPRTAAPPPRPAVERVPQPQVARIGALRDATVADADNDEALAAAAALWQVLVDEPTD